MWTDKDKYTGQFKYVELAHYIDHNPRTGKPGVIRDQKKINKNEYEPIYWDINEISVFAEKYNNTGVYTSVWQFNKPAFNSLKLGPLYFDLDSPDAEQSHTDTVILYEHLRHHIQPDAIRVYFSGSKGFHVECEPVALGIAPGNNLGAVFRYIANQMRDTLRLSSLDFAVYDERRIWRLPYSKHQITGLFKCELTEELLHDSIDGIKRYAKDPEQIVVSPQKFDYKANEWYREFTYKIEEEKQQKTYTTQDLIDRFNKQGSKIVKADGEREFDPVKLFDNCHAILDWWKYSEEKHDLPHEARLFLCSILTYSDEAIFYLHEILKNCSDYSWERSNAHIQDWIRRREMGIGGRPYTCERANSAGVGCGDCHLESKKKWIEINGKFIETDEEVLPSPYRFGYSTKRH